MIPLAAIYVMVNPFYILFMEIVSRIFCTKSRAIIL